MGSVGIMLMIYARYIVVHCEATPPAWLMNVWRFLLNGQANRRICYMEPKRMKSSATGSRRPGPAARPAKGMALWKKDRRPTEIYWRPRDWNVIPGQGGRETMTRGYYFCFMRRFLGSRSIRQQP